MRNNNFPQYHNIRIQYIYYDVLHNNEISEGIVHQIHYDRILECLLQKNFVIRKEDLIYLLKDDGARFFENSLRIYEPTEDNYFQIPDDWELEVDDAEPEFSLLLWIKSNNPTVMKRLEDVTSELTSLRTHLTSSQDEIKSNKERFGREIEKLRLLNQVIFTQLAKIHEKAILPVDGSPPQPGPPISPVPSPGVKQPMIDIALMYSEPLVKRNNIGIISLGDPVDYEEECNKLLDLLKSKEKRIDVSFEIASIENLIKVLSIFPKILHIICHGEFSKENNMFYLCFEEEGELKELYSKDLKEILTEVELKTQIVFVNACHSEEVAKVFQEAGIPCVIAVQSELKIEDHVAQKFSETFYWQLFEGKSVREAFKLARVSASGRDTYTCCCAHSHKPNCEWYKLAKEEGFEKAHHLHIPTCTNCKYNNKFLHNTSCQWVQDFLMYVCGVFDLPDTDTFHACCCSPEKEHNEVMKFKLLCSDEVFEKQALFQDRERGKVTIKSYHSCVDQKFPVKRLMGRNKELYEMYEALTDREKKFVNLYGIEGVGKSSLVKQISNYLFERGFFKDKIAIIMLDRTPSITHFRSDLFKEVSGAYDLKSFCEAIKNNRVLFILEKADRLLKQDAEQFRHDLAYITEFAANVKFIIITNDMMSLKLVGVAFVRMRDLKKIDVAKLLCKNAYSFLKWDERNIYNLQQHGIFDIMPLTPQGVWSVTEKLRHGKSLDDIEREMMLEKEQSDRNPINELDEAVRMTLDDIKATDETAYELLIFLCLFPAGLSYQDLEELEGQQRIPMNWKFILFSFLTANTNYDDQATPGGETPGAPNENVIDRNSFKPDHYIWINIIKDPVSGEIYFEPTQFLTRYIENNLIEDSLDQNIMKLEYLTILSLSLIEQMKATNGYHEKLIEFSTVSTYGIWMIQPGKFFDVYSKRNKVLYVETLANDVNTIKKLFQAHEANFICCIEPKIVQDILQIDESKREHIIEIIEILYLSVPSLFKLIQGREAETIELARRAGKLIEFLEEDPRLQALEAKLNLLLTSLYLESKVNPTDNLPLVKVQLGLLTEQEGNIQHERMRNSISSEIAFAKAVAMYKEYKMIRKRKDFPHKDLKQMLKTARGKLEDDKLFDVCRAKITLLECKARELYGKTEVEKELVQEMENAQRIMSAYDAQMLLMKVHYMFACLKVDLERRKMKNPENTLDNIREITQKLARIKNYHLLQHALRVAKEIKDKPYEAKIKRQIDEINREIRFGYFNVIIFMRASPLIDQREPNHEMVPIGFSTKTRSDFRQDVFQTLSRKNKVLYLKFEHLTKEKLKDCLQSGCRILQLTCNHIENDSLCVEGELGKLERISLDKLRELFSPIVPVVSSDSNVGNVLLQAEQKVLDVLILAAKNNASLAEFFVGLKIPHVIMFEFTNPEGNYRQKIYEDECIEKFCTYFYEELITQKSVNEAFEVAYEKVINYLGEFYFEGNISNVNSIIGTGPVLLPKDTFHNEILFSDSTFPLMPGKIEDISSMRYPNNIKSMYLPFTGRKMEICEVADIVCENKDFLILYGASGIGKTHFLLELGHYLLTRSKFTHGVFYVPLKRLKATNLGALELIDLLKETTGIEIQKVMSNSFKGKNLLLIFDDFDLFYGKDAEFPRMVFKTLKECKIACILVHKTKKEAQDSLNSQQDSKFPQQNKEDIEEILKGASEYTLQPFNDDQLAQILLSLVNIRQSIEGIENLKENEGVKQAEGIPTQLIKSLVEKRIQVGDKTLELDHNFAEVLHFEQDYLDVSKFSNFLLSPFTQVLPLNKYGSSVYYESAIGKVVRTSSNMSMSENRNLLNASFNERKVSKDFHEGLKSPHIYHPRTGSVHRLGESSRRHPRHGDNSRSQFDESPPMFKKEKGLDRHNELHLRSRNMTDYEEEKTGAPVLKKYYGGREEEKEEEDPYECPSIDSGLEKSDNFSSLHDAHIEHKQGNESTNILGKINENSDG